MSKIVKSNTIITEKEQKRKTVSGNIFFAKNAVVVGKERCYNIYSSNDSEAGNARYDFS